MTTQHVIQTWQQVWNAPSGIAVLNGQDLPSFISLSRWESISTNCTAVSVWPVLQMLSIAGVPRQFDELYIHALSCGPHQDTVSNATAIFNNTQEANLCWRVCSMTLWG